MITDLKLIKEGRNYVIKFFNQRPKTLENYGSLLVALDEVAKSIEEEYIKVAQKIIDLGIDTPVYIKEQKKWIVPEIINDSIMKIMIIDRDDYKQLSNNPIEIKDNILKVKDIKKDNSDNLSEEKSDVDITNYMDKVKNRDCENCRKDLSECGACLSVDDKEE